MNEIYNELDVKNKIVICSQSKRDVETIDNKRVKIKKLSNYHINYIYNEMERHNKSAYYFLSLL